jgi:glycine oxidase
VTQARTYDVVVVGGGPVGAACARDLAEAGRSVLIVDRGENLGEGWRAAAGMLAAQVSGGPDDPLFELGLAGRERLAELAPRLFETTGVDVGFWQPGIARIAKDEADATKLRSEVAWQRQQGHLCDWFDPGEVRTRWPWLGTSHGALWASQDAALHPIRLVEALLTDAQRLGATLVRDRVLGLERHGDRITGVFGRESYSAGNVVIAAGAWGRELTGLPRPISVEPVRGQMASLAWPEGVEPAIIMGQGCYVVARDGEAVVGSTMEHAGFSADATAEGIAEIFTQVARLWPQIARGQVRSTWAGLRPVTPDGLPIIGAEPKLPGLWYALGHGRNGILLSAITGQMIQRLIDGEKDVEELHKVRPERFWNW